MSYKIIITRIEQEKQEKDGEWTVIDNRPWTEKELAESARYSREEEFAKTTPLKEIRGYAPPREVIVNVDVKVLEQTVDTLDLAAVIKAINNI